MADPSAPIQFEDIPLEDARRMGRGPRMEPMLYDTLRQNIQSLSTEATRIHLGPEITPERTKRYILRIAGDLNVPVTVRRVLEGVIFWRSHKEDTQQAQEIAGRLEASATCQGAQYTHHGGQQSSPADEIISDWLKEKDGFCRKFRF
jgi:hypothetical protein